VLWWIIKSVGLWGILTFIAAVSVFFGPCYVVLRAPNVHAIRSFRTTVLLPLLMGIVAAVFRVIEGFQNIPVSDVTAIVFVMDAIFSAWGPLSEALMLTIPSYLVLVFGRHIRIRRRLRQRGKRR